MRNREFARIILILSSVSAFLFTGCALKTTAAPIFFPGTVIQGSVHGGQQPFVSSQVYLFAANTTGYGNASVSLLKAGAGTILDANNTDPTYGDYYVLTDANGSFTISGDYTCTPSTQIYLYAVGGRPSGPSILANSAAGFLAAIGDCPSAGNFATAAPDIVVNEVSTIATAYAIAGFATDAVHVSSSGTPLAQIGIANAFANVANLESLSTGAALATTPAGNGTVPIATLNTLANILAACVNTNDVTSSSNGISLSTQCSSLFSLATSNGTASGTQPGDTATAAIYIAHNPGANIASLFVLSSASAPFAPTLSTQPNDFTIGINLTGGGLNFPAAIAIDGYGNAWIGNQANPGTVTEFSSSGSIVSGSPFTGGGLDFPSAIAIDSSQEVWIANTGNFSNASSSYVGSGVTKLTNSGSVVTGSPFIGGGLKTPSGIAIDGVGRAWVANYSATGGSVTVLTNSGTAVSGSPFTGGGLNQPYAISIDGSGDAWIANNYSSNSVTKLFGSGAPASGSPFTGGGLTSPDGIAIDSSGNAWIADGGFPGDITKISNSGSVKSSINGGGLAVSLGIAIDGSGNIWVANNVCSGQVCSVAGSVGSVTELSNSGVAVSPSQGFISGNIFYPQAIAIDGSGNAWITNQGPSKNGVFSPSVTELIGVATPVITPICVGLPTISTSDGTSSLGTRP